MSFRAVAMMATSFGLPAATNLSREALRAGLCRLATMAPMNSAARTSALPPPMKLFRATARICHVQGERPVRAATLPAVEVAQFRRFGDERAGNGLAD